VDLAVEDHRQAAVGRAHRLVGERREVEDRQARVAQADAPAAAHPHAAVVGATAAQRRDGFAEVVEPGGRIAAAGPVTGDSTHCARAPCYFFTGASGASFLRTPYIIPTASQRKACSGVGRRLLPAMPATRNDARPAAAPSKKPRS